VPGVQSEEREVQGVRLSDRTFRFLEYGLRRGTFLLEEES